MYDKNLHLQHRYDVIRGRNGGLNI